MAFIFLLTVTVWFTTIVPFAGANVIYDEIQIVQQSENQKGRAIFLNTLLNMRPIHATCSCDNSWFPSTPSSIYAYLSVLRTSDPSSPLLDNSTGCQCINYNCGCCLHLDLPSIYVNDTGQSWIHNFINSKSSKLTGTYYCSGYGIVTY